MGILRSDIISHSQLPDGNQSVEFDGTGDYLQVPASEAWDIGRANRPHKAVTIEWWIYLNSLSSHTAFGVNQLSGIVAYGSNGRYAVYGGGQTLINESNSVLDAVGLNEWHHYALVLHPGPAGGTKNVEFYRDGKLSVSSTYAANVGLGVDSTILSIGADAAICIASFVPISLRANLVDLMIDCPSLFFSPDIGTNKPILIFSSPADPDLKRNKMIVVQSKINLKILNI